MAVTLAGTGAFGYSGDGPATAMQLNGAQGIVPTPNGGVYVADTGNQRIRLVSPAGSPSNVALTKFSLVNHSGSTLTRIEADFDGNGTVDFTTTDAAAPIQHYYLKAGAYVAAFTAIDAAGNVYRHPLAVIVEDAQQRDQFFGALWGGMNASLKRGDVDAAAVYLNESAKRKYRPVFEALKPHFAEILASYSPPRRVSISEDIGEYAVLRLYNGQKRVYLVYFLRDADGVWRVDGM
jgi:hypothetical protein